MLTQSLTAQADLLSRRNLLFGVAAAACVAIIAPHVPLVVEKESEESKRERIGLETYSQELNRLLTALDPVSETSMFEQVRKIEIENFRTKTWKMIQRYLGTKNGAVRYGKFSVTQSFCLSNGQYVTATASFTVKGTDQLIVSEESEDVKEWEVTSIVLHEARNEEGYVPYQVTTKWSPIHFVFFEDSP